MLLRAAALSSRSSVTAAAAVAVASGGVWMAAPTQVAATEGEIADEVFNWSGTHSCRPTAVLEPDSIKEVKAIVEDHHRRGRKLRVVGGALSPNGIGLTDDDMLSVAACDRILNIDLDKQQVVVEPGLKVGDLCTALDQHGLTLQNLASIAEQQIGGFVQVGAHGTGARIPPVDMQVVSLKLITPAHGELTLSETQNPHMFALAKVALGALGVVSEVTLQCVPKHDLLEHTYTLSRDELREQHLDILREHQHARFMWIPFTDTVVVVTNDPLPKTLPHHVQQQLQRRAEQTREAQAAATAPLRALLEESRDLVAMARDSPEEAVVLSSAISEMSFAQLRDELLALNPLDVEFVKRVNAAEAAFWKLSEHYATGPNVSKLQFECGGQQWVSEVAFPAGDLSRPTRADFAFMEELLALIEEQHIPAPAPIEQRWTSNSTSKMSPAARLSPHEAKDAYTSWVGIIMYLPSEDPAVRQRITDAFFEYKFVCADRLWDRFGAQEHWAKIEAPDDAAKLRAIQRRLQSRFPVGEFNRLRQHADPKNILANPLLDKLMPLR